MTHFLRKHWSQIQYSSNNLKYKDRGHQIHANNKLYFPSIFRGILDSMQLGNLKTSFIFFFRNFLAHIYHKKTLESLDFSAQYWIVDYSFSSFKKKWTLNALKIKKNTLEKKRVCWEECHHPLANPFLSLILNPAASCLDNNTA